jgi:RimJ/RimL family protein N-acetyltransferase
VIELRNLNEENKNAIYNWPRYPYDCMEIDYALRKDGWIDSFSKKNSALFSAFEDGELIGFSVVSETNPEEAEYAIALRADKLGEGKGKEITLSTLDKGFLELNYRRIALVVRKTNNRGKRLYEKVGFSYTGSCIKEIKGVNVQFDTMEISKETYLKTWKR